MSVYTTKSFKKTDLEIIGKYSADRIVHIVAVQDQVPYETLQGYIKLLMEFFNRHGSEIKMVEVEYDLLDPITAYYNEVLDHTD